MVSTTVYCFLFLIQKQILNFLKTDCLGRDSIWTVCSITEPDELLLTLASEPYFNQRSDPVYVRRLREHETDWNANRLNCLMPVTYSRLHRVVSVIPQTTELYEVFESDEYDSQVNHAL